MRRKILFVIPCFLGGGAEKVLISILRALNRDRFEPMVAIFSRINDYAHELPADVRLLYINKKNRLDFFRIVLKLSQLINAERPDILISFMDYSNYISVLARSMSRRKFPLILTELSNPSMSLKYQRLSWLKKRMVSSLYPAADLVTCCSHGVKEDLALNFNVPEPRCRVIYNPVDVRAIRQLSREEVDHPWFRDKLPVLVACGRLSRPKNYPFMLRSFALLLKHTPARLCILGDGELKSEIISYSEKLGLSGSVQFLGFRKNPFKYMARSTAFILSSEWEGLPNVIIEAMASGAPVISTDCPSGPSEIIQDRVNGLLMPLGDEHVFAAAVLRVLQDKELRGALIEGGGKRAEDFRLEKIMNEYEEIISHALSKCNKIISYPSGASEMRRSKHYADN